MLVRTDEGFRAVGWAVTNAQVASLQAIGNDPDSPLLPVLAHGVRPTTVDTRSIASLAFQHAVAIPFPGFSRGRLGLLLVEAAQIDDRIDLAETLLRRAGPTLNRALQLDAAAGPAISATVEVVELTGPELVVSASIGRQRIMACLPPRSRIAAGQRLTFAFEEDAMHLFDAESGLRIA